MADESKLFVGDDGAGTTGSALSSSTASVLYGTS